jgi:hypothetical protein
MDGSWGMHGGRRKMDEWGRNIALEILHVLVGSISEAWVAWALKHVLGHPPKLDMFK